MTRPRQRAGNRRSSSATARFSGWPTDDARNIAWARDFVEAVRPFSDGSAYLNFPGFLEEGDALVRDTYGAKLAKLAAIKRKYDPDNVFRRNANIKPADG